MPTIAVNNKSAIKIPAGAVGTNSVGSRSLTESTLTMIEGFEMTDHLVCCHSERKRGIFLDPKIPSAL
jgi:hypothetical protein